ncbi:flagellar hook-basal body complex protein FliE [Arenibaculum pallidiluteum]|uniref:flagellar hook-basal body complex protein FliE n=1 Tax=Arenibaculum pallidiluteum TaxID=2812559 RepID=UPI001A95A7CE|nr:flagellar hook-basal body complex protein FliE [Arenibaculum pallidiluteum]
MVTTVANAISAYANAAKAGSGPKAAGGPGESFLDLVKNAAEGAIENIGQSEKVSAAAAVGKADLLDVVSALSNAEVTLQTVVSVRDKVVNAYQEIMRMPV